MRKNLISQFSGQGIWWRSPFLCCYWWQGKPRDSAQWELQVSFISDLNLRFAQVFEVCSLLLYHGMHKGKAILSFLCSAFLGCEWWNSFLNMPVRIHTCTHIIQGNQWVLCEWINFTDNSLCCGSRCLQSLCGGALTPSHNVWKKQSYPSEKLVFAMESVSLHSTYFGSDDMSYESCEQTVSYDGSKLTWSFNEN